MKGPGYDRPFVSWITFVSAMGGLLFGYDWVVIGGAKPFYERFFGIAADPNLQGLAMSAALFGCIAGALGSGWLSDRYGRKRPLIISAAIFVASSLGTGFSQTIDAFIAWRILGGTAIGLASSLSPMYIAEISPAHIRGKLVSVNQLTIVIGILLAQIFNYLIADVVPAGASDAEIIRSWNGQVGWRWMFWATVIPSALFFFVAFFIPDSPRWLVKVGRKQSARDILRRIGGEAYAVQELHHIENTLAVSAPGFDVSSLFERRIRPVLFLGIVLAIFQQWCGINVVFNYAEEIFRAAGYGVSETLRNIVVTGIVNLVSTFVAMRTVDRWGRKKLMVTGALGLAVVYVLLGLSFRMEARGIAVFLLVILAIATYAMSLAPITWVILSEIFPNRVRGAAMALATASLWISCMVLTYTFPLLNGALLAWGTFWVYAGICFAGFLYILWKLPETKGKTLEEVEAQFSAGVPSWATGPGGQEAADTPIPGGTMPGRGSAVND